jgi:hypothetical protein
LKLTDYRIEEEHVITNSHASGTFEVKMTPVSGENTTVGRFSLEKKFNGDLEGSSAGEMLAINSNVAGSAGYVAMEQVTGTLAGRSGTFALQQRDDESRRGPT